MWNETYERLTERFIELTGIFFKYELTVLRYVQRNCEQGESFPFSSFWRKFIWSQLERNGDNLDKTLANQYFMTNFIYHDSVLGVT